MNTLAAFGLFAVTAMLVFYALRSPWFILAFSGACLVGEALEGSRQLVSLWKTHHIPRL